MTFLVGLCIRDFLHVFFPMTIVWFFGKVIRNGSIVWFLLPPDHLWWFLAPVPHQDIKGERDHRCDSRPWGGFQHLGIRKSQQETDKESPQLCRNPEENSLGFGPWLFVPCKPAFSPSFAPPCPDEMHEPPHLGNVPQAIH